ncbi:hypothetical protein LMG28688_05989 [Paraburkholderia caffeinitolerans]|uniref:Lipoprotein n=1 Tax=Paraburkholderia caffeinitolerans TaxID=1723730 RepID=A0A6J5GRQ3_9BURK|nr:MULTISPECIES: hypothetical protein [Paraburkholderia]CAB3804492.1 hypothetical protein LMG28688_05989 [Paraburkholderia caffeinitolerans]
MNKRKACLVGLTAGATLLAGCVAQYQNPSECEQEMRTRLASASLGALSVTHTAVAYRGKRVVVEGLLDRGALPASGKLSASAAAAVAGASATTASASGASAASASTASMPTATSTANSTAAVAARGASAPLAASMVSAASGASAASAPAAAPVAEGKPTTPMAVLAVKLGLHKAPRPSTAAECTYDKTGSLTSFRWLSPGALAKTTPAPEVDDE